MTATEIVHPPGAVVTPDISSEKAYEAVDKETEVKQAIEEKIQKESKPEEDKFSQKFAALSRREKEMREYEKKIESRLAELDAKLESFNKPKEEPKVIEEPLDRRLMKDPLNELSKLGLSYDKLTQLALNDGKLTPDMQMQVLKQELEDKFGKTIEELRNELSEKEKTSEQEKYEEVVNNYVNELTNFVNNNEKYELIRANDSVQLVYDVIEDYHKQHGRILSMDEAADQVESYLEEGMERIFNKTQKLKAKFGINQKQAEKLVADQEQKGNTQSPTLSNTFSTAVSNNNSRPRDRDESIRQAASLLTWDE